MGGPEARWVCAAAAAPSVSQGTLGWGLRAAVLGGSFGVPSASAHAGPGGVSAVHLSRGLELARLQWARCTLWHLTNEVCVCVCECAYVHAHEAVLRTPNLLYARPSGLPSSILQTRLSARHTQSATLDVARGAARAGASAAFGSPQPEPGR